MSDPEEMMKLNAAEKRAASKVLFDTVEAMPEDKLRAVPATLWEIRELLSLMNIQQQQISLLTTLLKMKDVAEEEPKTKTGLAELHKEAGMPEKDNWES